MSPLPVRVCSNETDLFGDSSQGKMELGTTGLGYDQPLYLVNHRFKLVFFHIIQMSHTHHYLVSLFVFLPAKTEIKRRSFKHCFSPSTLLWSSHNASKLHESRRRAPVTEVCFLSAQPLFSRFLFSAFPSSRCLVHSLRDAVRLFIILLFNPCFIFKSFLSVFFY